VAVAEKAKGKEAPKVKERERERLIWEREMRDERETRDRDER